MTDEARILAERFYAEIINAHSLDSLEELVAPDFVEHGTPPGNGREAFREFLAGFISGLPDARLDVEDWITEGEKVVARCRVYGTHRGEFLGYAPTGRRIEWTAIHIWHVRDGLLHERWSQADLLGIVEQLQPA